MSHFASAAIELRKKQTNFVSLLHLLQESTISIPDKSKLPHLRNPEILIGENDLTSLSYLNEPEGEKQSHREMVIGQNW